MSNVSFDNFSAKDVAEMFKVSQQAVCEWCRKGFIKAIDVSGGTGKPRWQIPDSEIDRVDNLMKRFGKLNWRKHAKEGLPPEKPQKEEVVIKEEPVKSNAIMENVNAIADIVYKIADLKDELENIEARRTQITNEIASLKKQITDLL